MGSGSSSKAANSKYQAPPEPEPPKATSSESHGSRSMGNSKSEGHEVVSNVRACDRCGEVRKTANFDNTQWLCAACQLASGARPTPKKIQMNDEKPQPVLARGSTQNFESSSEAQAREARQERRKMLRSNTTMSLSASADAATASSSETATVEKPQKKSRRAAKGHAALKPAEEPTAKPAFKRAQTVALEVKLERNDFRSSEGMNSLKKQAGIAVPDEHQRSSSRKSNSDGLERQYSAPAEPPPIPKKKLAAGYSQGDTVNSLISRLRNGARVLETGHEGIVAGMVAGSTGEEHLRFLVQFKSGIDWFLSPTQLCQSSSYSSAKQAGLPGGYIWGSRVQVLVTYLSPAGAAKAMCLGYAGTVVGPGQVKGKLGVRLDNDVREWSIWPNMLCLVENYENQVTALLPGGLQRGDRVISSGKRTGRRATPDPAKGTFGVDVGEEGTVVGPGHAAGTVLVHFDDDSRVWSLLPAQVALASGDDCL